jgi:UDP-N-acetylmuramate dehydrogenase
MNVASVQVQENVPLKDYSTFRIGGSARHFMKAATHDELREALNLASQNNWPIFILAAGSNIIFPDEGWPGLVIFVDIKFLKIHGEELAAGAANMMSELVDASVEAGLQGLEWAGGLPGTFGGAIRGNAGAFRGEIKDTILTVTSIECRTGREITRTNKDCEFGYRDSIFKRRDEVIVSATLKLAKGDATELRRIADSRIAFRKDRHPLEYPNVGSIFKNTPLERVPEHWLTHFHDFIKVDPFPIVPTGKIIEDAGLKGYRVGDAEVSEKHANYIVNRGEASAADVVSLIEHIRQTVRDRFQIELETEPEIVQAKKPS